MTNNELCDALATAGCFITSFALGGAFFGVSWCWIAVAIGIILSVFALWEYEN